MTESPLKKENLSDQVIKEIKRMIARGKLFPGDRLPSEQEFADRFGIGRHTVREAFKKMEALKLVKSQAGRGSFISTVNSRDVIDFMTNQLIVSQHEMKKLMELRLVLEVSSAKLAAIRATETDIEELENVLHEMKLAINPVEFVEKDVEFHLILAKATKNDYYGIVLNTIRDMLFEVQKEVVVIGGAMERALKFHTLILESVKSKNTQESEHWMNEHMQDTSNAIANN